MSPSPPGIEPTLHRLDSHRDTSTVDKTPNTSTITQQNTSIRQYRHTILTDYFNKELDKINIPHGDLHNLKDPNTVRIYFQNINGVKHDQSWQQWEEGIIHSKEIGSDIICIAETNIVWNHHNYNQCNQLIKKHYGQTKLATANCSEITLGNYQPGGTATIATAKWTSRTTKSISDPLGLGRWSGLQLRTKNQQHLYIVTAYCPNKDNKHGSNTAYQQQWRALRQSTNDEPDPCKQFFRDLSKFIHQIHDANDKIILTWDANDDINSDNIISFMANNNLSSLMGEHTQGMTTYARGKRVIDHIMGSTTITPPVRKGYFAFYDGAWPSDHRGLFVDIDAEQLFSGTTDPSDNASPRLLTSTNAQAVRKFLSNIQQSHQCQPIVDTITELLNTREWNESTHDILEQQDVLFTKMLLDAESKLQPKYSTPWSPTIHKAAQTVIYWKIALSQQKNHLAQSMRHKQLETELDQDRYVLPAHNLPHAQYRKAKQLLKQARRDAVDNRKHFLTIRHEELILHNETRKAKIIRNITNAERRKNSFRTIKHKLHPNRSTGGLSHVLYYDSDNNLQRIDNRTIMEEKLHERNRIHFQQAHGTPFTIPPLSDTLGDSGCTDEAIAILNDEENPPLHAHQAALALLQECKTQRSPLPHTFPITSMIDGFSKWRESTTTSPSGKHLGIYRSICTAYKHNLRTPTENIEEESIASKLVFIQNSLINLAIKHCHTYNRWTTVHNFFLEKIPGTPLLDKLRVIHLYEADWNIILKYFIAHKLLKTAATQGTITTEQSGGRPNRSAIDEATKTVLLYETCRLQRRTGGIMYNDAKACFDRVIENISNLSCMREGLPIEIAKLHNQTFKNIKYYIKHKRGIGHKPNQHSQNDPFYGVGQGSGDAGARWGLVSDCIIRAYNTQSSDAQITGPISKLTINEKCQLFVDDSRLFALVMNDEDDTVKDILKNNTQKWEALLHATGGKLELQKCKYCIFSWSFNSDGTVSLNDTYNVTPIQLQGSETQQLLNVEAITTSTSYKLLGIQIAFDGNHKEQHQSFHTKCQQLARLFSQLPLIAPEVYAGYIGMAIPSLRYALAATSIPHKAIQQSQKVFVNALLPKLGYNRHFPRKVTFAPTQVGGLGILNFSIEQSIAHTLTLVAHLRHPSPLTINCIQLLESYQVYTGILSSPTVFTAPIPHIEATIAPWLEIVREFLHRINARIEVPNVQQIQPLRQNDQGIMYQAMQHYDDKRSLRHINHCRLYLQVNTIAEISTCNGTHLLPQAIYGTVDTDNAPNLHKISTSKLHWPKQQRPPTAAWTQWKLFLSKLIKPTTSSTLITPLGPWNHNAHSQRHWHFTYIHEQIIEYHNSDSRHHYRHTPVPNTLELLLNPTPTSNLLSFPIPVTPATISPTTLILHRQARRSTRNITPPPPKQLTWENSFITDILGDYTASSELDIYTHSKLQHQVMQFHWKIKTAQTILYDMHGHAPLSTNPTKLRAETYAIIYALTNTHHNYPILEQHNIRLWITQRSLYNKLQPHARVSPTSTLAPESETIATIVHLLSLCPNVTLHDASRLTNIDDFHAIEIRQLQQEPINTSDTVYHSPLPGNLATLYINNIETSSNLAMTMRSAATTPDYIDYLITRNPTWTATIIDTIDWQIQGNAIQKLNYNQQKTVRKFIHTWLPTNGHPSCSHVLTTQCPLCNTASETQQHFMECPSLSHQWQCAVQSIQSKAKTLNIDPILRTLITQALQNRQTHYIPDTSTIHYNYNTLINQQTHIGWTEITRGRVSMQWARLQDRHSGLTNGHQTLSKLIHHIFLQILDIWTHRCNIQHGQSDTHSISLKQQLVPKVQALYNTKSKLLQLDALIFDTPIEDILIKPLKQLEFWIRRTTIIVQEGLKRAKDFTKHGTPSIKHFFLPKPAQPTTIALPVTATLPLNHHHKRHSRIPRRKLSIDSSSDQSTSSSATPRPNPDPFLPTSPSSTSTASNRPKSPPDRFAAQNYNTP